VTVTPPVQEGTAPNPRLLGIAVDKAKISEVSDEPIFNTELISEAKADSAMAAIEEMTDASWGMTEVATAFMFARREETPASREVASGIGAAEVNEARRDETANVSEVGSALARESRSAMTEEMAATAEVSLVMAATADVASPITEETAANWLGSSEITAERAAVRVAIVASSVASATMDDTIPSSGTAVASTVQ
jgi:hypothetical protein